MILLSSNRCVQIYGHFILLAIIYLPFIYPHLYTQNNYTIKFGKLIKIRKNDKEIVILKNKIKFITKQLKIYTPQIIITTINKTSYIIGHKEIFFLFTNIKGKCKSFKGNLSSQKFTFFNCNVRIKLEKKVTLYSFSPVINFKSRYSMLIFKNPYFTTCSFPKPHYKVKFENSTVS